MVVKKAVLVVSHEKVAFRFQRILRCHLDKLLIGFKHQFPEMSWNYQTKTWELPFEQFQAVYELCRSIFGYEHVKIQHEHYTRNQPPYQQSLFD
ncbi:MAG: hypothetical protein U0350_34435 [Caldilineaceae bacterium]